MPINDKVKQLYDALKEDGGDVGSEQEFSDWFFAQGDEGYQNRKYVYDTFKEAGADIGENYEEFRDWLGLHAVKRQPSVEDLYSEGSEYNLPSSSKMEQEKPGMWGKVKEGGSKILSSIFGANKEQTPSAGSTGRTEAAQMPTKEQLIDDADNYGNPVVPVKNVADTAGTGAVVGNVIQKNTQPPFYEGEQRTDYTKPYYDNDNGFGEFAQQGIDRLRQGQEATDPTRYKGEQLQIPLYNQEAALRGDIQRIDADVMRKFNEELAMNQQKAKDYMKDTPGNPFAPTGVNLMNIGREANKIADPSKAIESAIKYADEQTKDMPDEVRYQVIESLLGQMEEQLINERIPSGTAEYVFWRGFKDSDLGRIMSSVVDTNYEKYLDQVAASRYKAGFWENLGKGAVTLASDMWEYVLPAGAAGKAGKWAGGKISGRIMNDLIRRGVPKSQAARIAERLTANSVGKSILQHGASNAVTFGTAGAISGAVEGLTEPATVQGFDGKHSIESEKIKNDIGLYGDLHDEVAETIKQAEAKQYSAENLFGKIFERAAWGVGTGVATSFGAPLGEIIGHGRGVAGKILGDATRLGVNATAMTGVGALEQATTPGAQPLTFEDLLLAEANNLLTFGALEARGIYNRAKNYRNIQQFEKAYDITDADKAKMKDLGYGDMLDAVEQLTTGKTAGAQPRQPKPNIITRLVNGEKVSEAKMPPTEEQNNIEQIEPQMLKKGLGQLANDYNAGRISEEEARKWYGLITGDYSQQLQPITGVSQRTDISPEGKEQHFVDYLDAKGRRIRTVEVGTKEEAANLASEYQHEAQLNQISALEDMITDKDVSENIVQNIRKDFLEDQRFSLRPDINGMRTMPNGSLAVGGIKSKIEALNDLRARKKLHEMGEGKALTAEEERILEEGLSNYERDVANIFGREDQLQEALQKQAEGGDLLPYEESLIQSAQNIYRNHAGHSKAASDFAREFEKRNGMEEGTLSQILEKKDRSEAEQKAVDDYVTDLQEYLRPRTEQIETGEGGNPATNATESVVDVPPGVELTVETPAEGAAQTAVAGEAYSKGQAAVQANDAAAMRNIGYEMQKADARISKLFTDDEANAISDAVESGDEDALAALVQKHTEPAKLDAIEKLKEAHDAMRGVEDAINDSYIGNDEAIRAEISPYQSEQGEIVPLKLSNGSSVYYVSGDLNNAYGTVMVAYTGEDGMVRHAQVPVKEITEAGTPMGIDDFVQLRAEDERNRSDERYEGIISGTELRKGIQVELTMDNKTGVFTVDGFFSNGDVQLRDKNGGTIRMTKDEALEMMQATEDKRINQDLADEQAAYKEAERVRQEEEKARQEAQRKFEEERRGKIAEIQKAVVDEAAAMPQPTGQSEEAAKWNGLAIADISDTEGVKKYLLDNYENEADADTFMNEQRRILRTHQRDDIQPEIDNISKQLDDYITGKTELSYEELTGLITQLSEWETEQNRLNGVADALKNISDALPKTYAERNAEVLKNASPYDQRMAELSKTRTNEDKVRIAKKLYGNDPDVGTLFDDLDVPADATELVSMFLKPRVLRWEGVDQGGVHLRGVEDELGKHMKRGVGRNVDSNNINTFLAAKGEGKTVDEFVHDIWESPENHPVGAEEKRFDDTEIRNALIDLLLSAKNPTEIRDMIIDGRIAEAERILKDIQDREEEYGRRELADAYHISPTEVESYEDYVLRNAEDFYLNDEEYQEINSIFAEENELRDEQNRRSQEMDRQSVITGTGGEGEGSQGEIQRQGAEVHATEDQGKPVNGEGENLTDGTAVPGSNVAGGTQGEFERAIDDLGRIEEEWNDKILDYVSQHYPTQAVVSAQTNSPKGKAERKAMLEDPVYQDMLRQQKEALDAADKKVTEAYKKEEAEPAGETVGTTGSFAERLAKAIEETNTEPTEGQKEAGNYKKGHLQFGGYNYTVENPKGSVRSGKDASGKPWSITMHNTYGYLTGKGHLGKDGDHLDVFINDNADLDKFDGKIYIVDQVNSDGSFDEHKIMYGFDNEVDALRNYLMNYSRPWHGMGNITGVDKTTFDKWVESSNRKQKPFAETRFGDNRDVVEKVMDGIEKKKEVADLSEPKIENNHPSSKVVQGLEDITVEDFLEGVRGDIESILSDNDLSDIVTIKGLALHGSRMRGDAREDSDIDVVVEYEGDISEDGLFNILNDADLKVNGITVDINPITKGKSGTLEQYMEQSRKYDEEITKKRQKTEQSKYQLSSETDSEGNRFFEKEGSIDLWTLPKLFAKARRQDAPIRLTERNLQHIIDEHHKEIGNTDDVLAFLDNIFNNAPVLRKARGRGMFVVVEQEKTDKAAIIKLMPSENGDYYNVETAGYYRKNKWKEYEDVIADLREPDQSDAVTDVSKPQTSNQNGRKSINAETQTSSSEGKDKKNIDTLQEKGGKFFETTQSWRPEELADMDGGHLETLINRRELQHNMNDLLLEKYKGKKREKLERNNAQIDADLSQLRGEQERRRNAEESTDVVDEPRPRRRNPKVVSHVEGNLFPEEKEGDLFDDKKAAAKPQPTKKPESKLEKLSDKQLLEGIGQNANSKDWDLYIDEYDKRHRDEYQDALAAYSDMLEKENVSLEDAYGMYADVAAKWNDKGFASDERSKLMAQVDALEEYVDRLESEAIEREEAEEEAAAEPQPTEKDTQKKDKFEQDKTDVRAHGYDLTKIRLRELGEGEVSHVERRYVENGTFSFTGGEHIESAADVAYIFRQLEDAAVENSFMVLIKDGVPTVIHLAIGSYNAVHAPIEQAFAAYKEIDPDNVIFLHNHPSGNLKASREDLALQKKVEAMFGRKALPGIIINTKSGKYAEFNSKGSNQIGLRPKSVDKDIPVRVFNFSKQVFAKDWNPETAFEGSDSRSMAAFVSSHRLGDHNKMSLIVMDQAGHITGNIFLPWTTTNEISKQANALQIATYVNQMGGRYALIYGNTTVTDSKDIKILKTNLDGYNVKLRDVMTIEGSANDKGLLFEPDVEYKGGGKDMMEAVGKQYHGKEMVFLDKTHGEEQLLKDLGMYDEVTKMKGSPEYDAIMEHLRKNLGKAGASYNRDTKKIYIFAPEMTSSYAEEAYFHENIHAILDDWYGESNRSIADRFWDVMPDDGKVSKAYVKEKSTDKSEYAEEAFAYWLSRSMQDGDVADFLNYFDEADKERINNILKTFGYDAEKESERRVRLRRNQHVSEAQSGYSETDEGLSRSESEGSGAGVKSGTLAYIKDVTLPSESSTSAQGDQYTKPAGVDSSEGKDTKNSDALQEKSQKYDYGDVNTDMARDPGIEAEEGVQNYNRRRKPRQKKGEGMASYFKRLREWEMQNRVMNEAANDGLFEPSRAAFEAKAHNEWLAAHKEWEENPSGKTEPIEWDYESRAEREYIAAKKEYDKKIAERMPETSYELTKDDLSVERESQVKTPGQRYTKDIADIISREYDHSTASDAVKDSVINRRKDIEELAAADSIVIHDIKRETDNLADSIMEGMGISKSRIKGVRALEAMSDGKISSQMSGHDVRRAMTYLIEKPMRLRDIASGMNSILESKHSPVRVTADDLMRAEDEINALRSDGEKLLDIRKRMEEENRDRMTMDELVTLRNVKDKAETVVRKMNNARGMTADDIMTTLSEVVKRVVPDDLKIKEISPEMQSVINTVKDWYNIFYDWLDEAGMRPPTVGYYKDYVNHVWDKDRSDPDAYDRYVVNRQPTKSRNMRTREIRTLMDGIELGLVPKYDDVADLMGDYSKRNILSWSNKKMLVDLSGIDIVERDSKGEVSAVMPMITSRQPNSFERSKYKNYEIPGVGDVWVYNAVSKNFDLVFESFETGKVMKALDNLASIAKNIELAWSGFHAVALTEVYAAQNMIHPKRAAQNFWKILVRDSLMQGQAPAYADPELYKDAAAHLVKLGATADYSPEAMKNFTKQLQDFFGNISNELAQKGVAGQAASYVPRMAEVSAMCVKMINAGMDEVLWTWLHDGLKLCQYKMMRENITFELDKMYGINEHGSLRKTLKAEKEAAKQPFMSESEGTTRADYIRNSKEYKTKLNKALDEAGQYINDMFGGQHFEVIGITQKILRLLRRIFLSPDWLISTQRHFAALFGYGSLYNKASVRNFLNYYKGIAGKGAKRVGIDNPWAEYDIPAGRIHRTLNALACYGVGCMLVFPFLSNLVNAYFRYRDIEFEEEKERKNPGYVSKYRLAYPDGMKGFEIDNLSLNPFNSFNIFGDYGMGGNAPGKRSYIFAGRYKNGQEMYLRWGKQFREAPEMLENESGEPAFPAPLLKRLRGKANPVARMAYDTFNYYTQWDKSQDDEDLEKRWKQWWPDNKLSSNFLVPMSVGAEKVLQNYVPFWVPTQKDKEWKAIDMFLPSTKGFTPYKARNYFHEFIKAQDEEGIKEVFKACAMNGMSNAQITAAFNSAQKTLESEVNTFRDIDGNSLQDVVRAYDTTTDLNERKQLKKRIDGIMKSEYSVPQNINEFMEDVRLRMDPDYVETTKANDKYISIATSEDILEDARIRQLKNIANDKKETLESLREQGNNNSFITDDYERENKKWFDIYDIIKEGESTSKKKKGTDYWKKKLKGDKKEDADAMRNLREKRKAVYNEVMSRLDETTSFTGNGKVDDEKPQP